MQRRRKNKSQPETTTYQAQEDETQIEAASQWLLMWWKFRKDRLAVVGAVVVILAYLVAFNAEFFAPKLHVWFAKEYTYAPPQVIRLFHEGRWQGPFVYGYTFTRDQRSLKKIYSVDRETIIPLGFFVKGEQYKWWGLFPAKLRFFGPKDPDAPMYLLGGDRSGRDVFSRIIYSARVSLTVGLIGVAFSLLIGLVIGGISGLMGGWIDNLIQRVMEIIQSVPDVPILLALAAVVPIDWKPVRVYFMISLLLSFRNWTGMARVVRGRFLGLRSEDFVLAARLDGANMFRLITKHMLPSFLSHIIASITLSIPFMILNETVFSFLGVGLRPPVVSWGVMLQGAQRIVTVANYPWLLLPALAVVIVTLSMNFLGNGLRDAADPYAV
jgi:peptide/nickel transport system permease protein